MRNKNIIYIIVCLFSLCLYVGLFTWWCKNLQYPSVIIVDAENLDLKAGDIIFMRASRSPWSFSWWDHLAIVVEDEFGKVFIVDMLDFTPSLRELSWEHYVGHVNNGIIGVRKLKNPLSKTKRINLLEAIRETRYLFDRYYILTWAASKIPFCHFSSRKDYSNCTAFIVQILQKLDLLNAKHKSPYSYTSSDLSAVRWDGISCPYDPEVYVNKTAYPALYKIK